MNISGDFEHKVIWSDGTKGLAHGWWAMQLVYDVGRWEVAALRGPFEFAEEADHECDLLVWGLAE